MKLAKSAVRAMTSGHTKNFIGDELNTVRTDAAMPIFYRAVVLDVLYDPLVFDDDDLELFGNILNNPYLVHAMPRNAVIAQRVLSKGVVGNAPAIFYPFFSSHFALPIKAGEHVWVMFEDHSKPLENGFWLSRIHEPRGVEDANFCHADRKYEDAREPGPGFYAFVNGVLGTDFGKSMAQQTSTGEITATNPYDTINATALSAQDGITTYEAVPRFTKRPGDLVIRGSNNTLICLGQQRNLVPNEQSAEITAEAEGTFFEKLFGVNPTTASEAPKTPHSLIENRGAIDIVVGREHQMDTTTNSRGKSELNKQIGPNEQYQEGDPDAENDHARIFLAMNTNVDKDFNIKLRGGTALDKRAPGITTDINRGFGDKSCAVVKADQVRIVARTDIKFVVQTTDSNGVDGDGNPLDNASITITEAGDVVITPRAGAFIRLGGPSADKVLLCGDRPIATGDGVDADPVPPWYSTMSGELGLGDGTGYVVKGIRVIGTNIADVAAAGNGDDSGSA